MSRAADAASSYLQRGWSPIPIPTGRKCPNVKGWPELRMSSGHVETYFARDPLNIGILLGDASGHLVDVDLDCEEACAVAVSILPSTNSVFGRRSKPTSHMLFTCKIESEAFKDPERGDTLLEIRSDGHQTVFPGSVHPSGESVEWYEDGPVAEISSAQLLFAVQKTASACVLARRWPTEGGRHDAQLTLSAILTRAGWSVEQTGHFVECVSVTAGAAPQLVKRISTARDAQHRLQNGGILRGLPSLRELFGDRVADKVIEWLGLAAVRVPVSNALSSSASEIDGPAILRIGSEVEIAKRVISDLHGAHGDVVFDEGRVWHFDGMCWQPKSDRDLRVCVQSYDGAVCDAGKSRGAMVRLNTSRINSVLFEMSVLLTQTGFFADSPTGMNCTTGFISFDAQGNGELLPHSPNHRCRYIIRGRWPLDIADEQAEQSLLSTLLRGTFSGDGDADSKIDLVGEVAAAAALGMATRLVQPRAIVLFGQTAENGKSQILDLIRDMLPADAVSAVPLHRFGDEKYLIQLAGKILNASDELASAHAVGSESFKLIVTGEPVLGRDVYRSAVQFRSSAQHIFATNHLPAFQGGVDRGVRRRLRVLRFDRTIPENERIPGIGRRICREEPDLALDFFVQGAGRLIRQGRFSDPTSAVTTEREWLIGADPVLAWLEEDAGIDATAQPVLVQDAYRAFRAWAIEEGYAGERLPPANTFSQRLQAADLTVSSMRSGGKRYLTGLRISPTGRTSFRATTGKRWGP